MLGGAIAVWPVLLKGHHPTFLRSRSDVVHMVGSEWGPRIQRISSARSTVAVAPRLTTSVKIINWLIGCRWSMGMSSAKWPLALVYQLQKQHSKRWMGHLVIPNLAVLSSGTWRRFLDSLKLQRRGHQRLISISTSDLDVWSPIPNLDAHMEWCGVTWIGFVLSTSRKNSSREVHFHAFPYISIHFPCISLLSPELLVGLDPPWRNHVDSQNWALQDPSLRFRYPETWLKRMLHRSFLYIHFLWKWKRRYHVAWCSHQGYYFKTDLECKQSSSCCFSSTWAALWFHCRLSHRGRSSDEVGSRKKSSLHAKMLIDWYN